MWSSTAGIIGTPPMSFASLPDTTQKVALGMIVDAVDPYWGGAEFIYLQYPASQAVKTGAIMSYDVATAFLAALAANTAIMGKAVAMALAPAASLAAAQYGWFAVAGQFPIWSSASVAANTAFGLVAAGQGGAVAAGKQINNARITLPATTTVLKISTQTKNGSPVIQVPNTDGWFPGIAITGTGIGAAAVINSIGIDGHTVTLSVNSTADGSVTTTGTYNDATNFWNIATFSRPGAQGPIT